MTYQQGLRQHYQRSWGSPSADVVWKQERSSGESPDRFSVLVFPPRANRSAWTYATCGMFGGGTEKAIELHLFSPSEALAHVESLTAVADFHRGGESLDLGHTVNLGRPWLPNSRCEYGLVSLPYLDGLTIEDWTSSAGLVKCYWLIPITKSERDFKAKHGLEALEQRFEEARFDYLDPVRKPVV